MKRSRFSEEQVIGILKEQEAGSATADVCRRHGISSATFYKWKAKFGGLEISDARRLKALEEENVRLKLNWPTRCWIEPLARHGSEGQWRGPF
jgi:putative transposase